ncbi:MAG TPA: PH domain-containing protein [Phycisphaerae bacterium]|nr:PH domain-containing protein [Phycisphaerae bacterium]
MPTGETVLYEAHEAMFRNHPFQFLLALLLCVVGVGVFVLIAWSIRCHGTMLTITSRRTILRKGIFSKHTNEIRHEDVSNIQVRQTFFQRLCGVGSIGISSAAQSEVEIQVDGIPHPDKVAQLINDAQP